MTKFSSGRSSNTSTLATVQNTTITHISLTFVSAVVKSTHKNMMEDNAENKRKEIYTYTTPWTAYTMAWRNRPEGRFQLAVGSFKEEYSNQIHLVQLVRDEAQDVHEFLKLGEFEHLYPATKVMWAPANLPLTSTTADLLATSGDYLRVWNLNKENHVDLKGVLNNSKHAGTIVVD
jgi:hypothetical protein